MYITNSQEVAKIAQNNGVDRIFIDLERNGKLLRQKGMNTVQSKHTLEDIAKVKSVLGSSELIVRINSVYEGTKTEIDGAIDGGADIVMLPYFKTMEEVESFLSYVNGRVKTMLLMETVEAVDMLDTLVTMPVDYYHVGLNDLHLERKLKFMFELLSDGTVDKICRKLAANNKEYGFGGIAKLGAGMLPAENIIAEHYRLGSSCAILSRSFCNWEENAVDDVAKIFAEEMTKLRKYENFVSEQNQAFFINNQTETYEKIKDIARKMK